MSNVRPVTIGDHEFHIRKFEPFVALKVMGDLQRKFLTPFLAALNAKDKLAGGSADGEFVAALDKLSASLDGEQAVALVKTLVSFKHIGVQFPNETLPMALNETRLAQSITSVEDLIQLAVEVVKHNYEGFFERAKNHIGNLLAQAQEDKGEETEGEKSPQELFGAIFKKNS